MTTVIKKIQIKEKDAMIQLVGSEQRVSQVEIWKQGDRDTTTTIFLKPDQAITLFANALERIREWD